MALTLQDVIGSPNDPDALNAHLLERGLVPPPVQPTPPISPATVAPMSAVAPPEPAVKPMTPPAHPHNLTDLQLATSADKLAMLPTGPKTGAPAIPDLGPVNAAGPSMPMAGAGPANPMNVGALPPATLSPLTESRMSGIPLSKVDAKEEFAAERPKVTAPIDSSEYWREKLAQDRFDQQNHWGTALNHPGILGKIAHGAALAGQIAGSVVAPNVVAEIPGSIANRGQRINEEFAQLGKAENRELQEKNQASEIAGRDVQTDEAKQRLAKMQSEQNLEKDVNGNVTGWKDPQGKLHGLDDPETPQGIKDIAGETTAKALKPTIEKMDNGDVVSITPGANGEAAKSEVVYHGDPKVDTELTQRTVNGQEHHVLVNKKTGEDIKDLGAFKTEVSPAQTMAKMKNDEEMVLGYDKDNKPHLMSRADADAEGLKHVTKAEAGALDKAATHHVVLNTLQTQLNTVVDASKALDQNLFQRGIISQALSHPSNTTIDNSWRAAVMSGASEETKDYVQAVIALREAGLALPKEITGGSRVSEVQASALWAGMPGPTSLDSKYAVKQAKKFQSDIDRLRERAPQVRGVTLTTPNEELAKGGAKAAAAGGAAEPPAGKTSVYDPNGVQHFVNSDKVDQFLKDPKYNNWTKNGPK
jgi:hypothetical protein